MGHEGHSHHHDAHDHHPTVHEHKRRSPISVAAWVVTCSDSRNEATDETGKVIASLLESHGHTVAGSRVIPDDAGAIEAALAEADTVGARAVIFNGGTGIGRRDVTIETLTARFEKTLPGFGEIFRALSFKEIGSAAMLSRAVAGTLGGKIVFCLPGSPQAAKLAMTSLILPELGHAAMELVR